MTKIKPYGTNILVSPVEKKAGPIGQSDISMYGDVLDIGADVKSVGDVIIFTKFGFLDVTIDDKKHYFVPEDPQFILGHILA
jgi:co-chaperonin GroES (HSP10)